MRVSATSLLSLAAGVIASLAVAAAWVPLSRDAARQQSAERERHLGFAASMVSDIVRQGGTIDEDLLERIRLHARAERVLVLDPARTVIQDVPGTPSLTTLTA